MKDINNKINNLKEKIEGIKEEQYKELFDSVSDILSDLSIYDDKLIFVGDGSVIHHDLIITLIKNPVFANSEQNLQTSISIGKSAYNKFTNGIYGDSNSLLPIYLKKSQAERNLAGEK